MGVSKPPVAALRDFVLTGRPPLVDAPVAAAAVQQGLAGLLLAGVGSRPGLVAAGVLERLREAMRRSLVRGVRLLDLAGRAQRLLLDRGVRSLPLKGTALAEPLHDSVGLRPMLDADLLALDAWPDAIETLLVEGYRPAARADHAVVLVCPVTGGILELHRSVTSCPGLFPSDPNGLWARSIPGDGPVGRLPSTEDLLVQLSLHASFQHGLVLSLVQWLDFRRLFERRSLDVARVIEIAGKARATAAVGAALRVAAVVVGAAVPEALAKAFPLRPRLSRWLERRERQPLCFVAPAPPALARLRLELARGRLFRLVAATLAPPWEGSPPGPRSVGARAIHLARRFVLPGARSWGGAPS